MRVSKTVKEYIAKEVRIRMEPKFQADAKESERQKKIHDSILEAAGKAAKAAWMKTIDEALAQPGMDFLEDQRSDGGYQRTPTFYASNAITIKDSIYTNSVHGWRTRLSHAVDEAVKKIIVELELGGTKADLERLLAEIGEG